MHSKLMRASELTVIAVTHKCSECNAIDRDTESDVPRLQRSRRIDRSPVQNVAARRPAAGRGVRVAGAPGRRTRNPVVT
jgi:hypothetical protein